MSFQPLVVFFPGGRLIPKEAGKQTINLGEYFSYLLTEHENHFGDVADDEMNPHEKVKKWAEKFSKTVLSKESLLAFNTKDPESPIVAGKEAVEQQVGAWSFDKA
ncbi:MAG: hypothetical protein ACYTDY_18935, partial [Planctomycetota bacterium]